VAGATGYAGAELVRLLSAHPRVELTALTSEQYHGRRMAEAYPFLRGRVDLILERLHPAELARRAEVIFCALPHGQSAPVIVDLLGSGCRVIDLGADFRLRDVAVYQRWYGEHPAAHLLEEAVYGLCEFYREAIRPARLVAVPGCYPTGMLLGVLPLLRAGCVARGAVIAVDAKSGATGAGRGARTELLFCEVDGTIRAYDVGVHRHTPEMEQEVALAATGGPAPSVLFAPHLLPIRRGILSTIYVPRMPGCSLTRCEEVFQRAYESEPFIDLRGRGAYPSLRDVQGTNRCAIGWWGNDGGETLVVVTAIDNLGKGAAGQAVQCLNLQLGCVETTALEQAALVP
jgi:N-acetyl-gamma-glutamyl-phosphate reductase